MAPELEDDAQLNEPVVETNGDAAASSEPTRPDPVQQALEIARKAAEEQRAEQARMAEATIQALRSVNQPQQQRYVEPPLPENVDPDLVRTIEQRTQRQLMGAIQPLVDAYQQDRTQDISYRASLERDRAARALPDYGSVAAEVDAYMADVPTHIQARPGAWEEAYYVVLGRKARRDLEAQRARQPQMATQTRMSEVPTTTIPAADLDYFERRFGSKPSASELDFFSKKEITEADFDAYMAKQQPQGRR